MTKNSYIRVIFYIVIIISTRVKNREFDHSGTLIKKEIQIALSFSFVVVHNTFLLYPMQFDQSENFFTDDMQVDLHVRSSDLNIL